MGAQGSKTKRSKGDKGAKARDKAELADVLNKAGVGELLHKFLAEDMDLETMRQLTPEQLAAELTALGLKSGQRVRLQAALGQSVSASHRGSTAEIEVSTFNSTLGAATPSTQSTVTAHTLSGVAGLSSAESPAMAVRSGELQAERSDSIVEARLTRGASIVKLGDAKAMSFDMSSASLMSGPPGGPPAFSVDAALAALGALSDASAHPASVMTVIASASQFLDMVKKARAVKDNATKLAERAYIMFELMRALENEISDHMEKHLGAYLKRFAGVLDDANKTIREFGSSRFLVRLLSGETTDAQRFAVLDTELARLGQEIGYVLQTSSTSSLKSLRTNNAIQTRLIETAIKLEETREFVNSGTLVIEKMRHLNGADVVLKDDNKLKQLAQQYDMDANELKTELAAAAKDIRLLIQAGQDSIEAGPHLAIRHPRMRAFWRRSFHSERVQVKDFFSHLSLFLEDDEAVRANDLLTAANRATLTSLLLDNEGGDTVHSSTVDRVFAVGMNLRVCDVIKRLADAGERAKRDVLLSSLPPLAEAFVARKEVAAIVAALEAQNGKPVWVTGQGGVGKTAAAMAAVRQLLASEQSPVQLANVVFAPVQGLSGANVAMGVLALANPSGINTDVTGLPLWASMLESRTLLIVDKLSQAAAPEAIPWLERLREYPKLSILVTSRALAPTGFKEVLIEPLTPDDAIQLAKKALAQPTQEQIDLARRSRVPGDIMVGLASGRVTRLRASSALVRAFRTQMEALRLLIVFAQPFTEDAALAVIGRQTNFTEVPREAVRSLLRTLLDGGLVQRHGDLYTLLIKSSDSPSPLALECFCLFYVNVLATSAQLYVNGNTATALTTIDRHRAHLDRLLLEIQLPVVSLLPRMLEALLHSGDLLLARWTRKQVSNFFKRVMAAVETVDGKQLPDHDLILAWAMAFDKPKDALKIVHASHSRGSRVSRLGEAYALFHDGAKLKDASLYGDALVSFQKVVPIRRDLLGENHIETAAAYNNVGTVYHGQGDEARALEYYEKALAAKKAALGDNHAAMASSYYNIGAVYKDQGLYSKSLEYYKKALAVQRAVLGYNHPSTATSYNNIGTVFNEQGNYERALEYYEKALGVYKSVLGENHPSTATSYNFIGTVYSSQGDKTRALEYYEKALAVTRNAVGDSHPSTATSFNNIASIYYNQGDKTHALEYYEKALVVYKAVLGENHPSTAASYNFIGNVYSTQGNYVRALEYYERALAVRKILLGDSHPPTATSFNNIGAVYKYQGDYARALEYYEKALAVQSWNLKKGKEITEINLDNDPARDGFFV